MYEVKLTPKDVELEAYQWTGYNFAGLVYWATCRGAQVKDFYVDLEGNVKLYNTLEDQFINLPKGHYVICGLKGEFYPCEPGALHAKYNVEEV